MVRKTTIAALIGIGILAAVYLGRPKVTKTITRNEPVPFEVPLPVPAPVPIPFLNLDIAKDFLQQHLGPLYTKSVHQFETAESRRAFNVLGTKGNWGANTLRQARANFERIYETRDSYTPI